MVPEANRARRCKKKSTPKQRLSWVSSKERASTKRYLNSHGKPVAFYSDKHTVFRVNKTGATSGTGLTQFGRALHELKIDIIYANSSQAKGRVERMNKTLQDRLVKEIRLEKINTIEDGNKFLPKFIESLNKKFSKEPVNPTDLHRPYTVFDKNQQVSQADIVSNKRLGSVLAYAKEKQDELGHKQRSKRAPKRRGRQQIADAEVKARNVALQP